MNTKTKDILKQLENGVTLKHKYIFPLKTDVEKRATEVNPNKEDISSDNKTLVKANNDATFEQKQFAETVQKIKELKLKNGQNSIAIGNILLQYKSKTNNERDFRNLLKHGDVNIKRTQADKLIKVSKFCCQSAEKVDLYMMLGIEKFAILIDAELEDKFECLAKFVDDKKISVSQLKKLVGKIKEQPSMPIEGLFTELKEELKEASKLKKNSPNENVDYVARCKSLENVNFIEEQISGKANFKNRLLGQILEKMHKDNVLIVPELSRIARSISQIFEVIDITKQKGIILYSIKENFSNNDKSITATVTTTVFALIAQIERDLISLRTREALQVKKASGVKLGRPKGKGKSKLDLHQEDILKLVELKVPKTIIAKQYNTSVKNLYTYLKYYQTKEGKLA